MLSEEKIKIMTNLAMFEKKEGNRIFPVNRYFKSDYISSKLLRSFFSYTLSFLLGLVLWVLCDIEKWLNVMRIESLIELGMKVGLIYLAGLVVYLIISLCIYARRYDYASRGMKVYMAKLKRLDKRYEGNSRPGARLKEDGPNDESSCFQGTIKGILCKV